MLPGRLELVRRHQADTILRAHVQRVSRLRLRGGERGRRCDRLGGRFGLRLGRRRLAGEQRRGFLRRHATHLAGRDPDAVARVDQVRIVDGLIVLPDRRPDPGRPEVGLADVPEGVAAHHQMDPARTTLGVVADRAERGGRSGSFGASGLRGGRSRGGFGRRGLGPLPARRCRRPGRSLPRPDRRPEPSLPRVGSAAGAVASTAGSAAGAVASTRRLGGRGGRFGSRLDGRGARGVGQRQQHRTETHALRDLHRNPPPAGPRSTAVPIAPSGRHAGPPAGRAQETASRIGRWG